MYSAVVTVTEMNRMRNKLLCLNLYSAAEWDTVSNPIKAQGEIKAMRITCSRTLLSGMKAGLIVIPERLCPAMAAAKQTSDQIIADASRTAEYRSNEIVAQARDKASEIRRQAEQDALLERKKAEAEMKHEIANVSAQLTGKLLQREINEEDHRDLIDSFLNELD